MNFLYRYVFRGIWILLLVGILTGIFIFVSTQGTVQQPRAESAVRP